ncbi:TPA: molecular chaperone, partial [Providencia stuartii]
MQTIENTKNILRKVNGFKQHFLILLFSLTSISAYSASNGVGLNATRIIYNQGESSTSIGARNNTDINYLARFLVTKNVDGTKSDTPFMVTPPLIKVDSGKSQEVKIHIKPNNLPTDRESVFYFSATMIPATNGPINGTMLNIGYNNVIKLFYRPKNLSISQKEASEKLSIESTSTGIKVINNSPYFISFSKLSVNGVKIDLSMKKRNTMIAPFDSFNYIAPSNGRSGIAKWTV